MRARIAEEGRPRMRASERATDPPRARTDRREGVADELACYQEEKRAGIVATGVVPEDVRVDVEARFRRLGIERDSTVFWEGFVEAIRATDVSKWLRE